MLVAQCSRGELESLIMVGAFGVKMVNAARARERLYFYH